MLIPEAPSHLCDGFYSVSNRTACREPPSMKICRHGERCVVAIYHFKIVTEFLVCMCTPFNAASQGVHTSPQTPFFFSCWATNLHSAICWKCGSGTVHLKFCNHFSYYNGADFGQIFFFLIQITYSFPKQCG